MSGVEPLPTSAFGIPYQPPSGRSGHNGRVAHMNRLEQACKDSDQDSLLDAMADLSVLVDEPPDSLPREDLSYFKTCLWKYSYEWVSRLFGGDPATVAEEEFLEMSLEDDPYTDLKEYCDYLCEGQSHEIQLAVREFQQRMEKELDEWEEALSESSEINEALSAHLDEPPPPANSSCGSSGGDAEELGDPMEGELASPALREAVQRVEEAEQQLRERVEDYEPRDHPVPVTCENSGCAGYFNGKGEHWFCDQLVTGVSKLRGEPRQYGGMEVGEGLYGGGQLGYAAWGNSVTVTLKVAEEGATEAAKASMTVFGSAVGGIGIAAGALDLALCARRWYSTSQRVKAIKELLDNYSNVATDEKKLEKQIADYALKKKKAKRTRTKIAAAGAIIGIVGGIIGVTALASNPAGWAIALGLGIAAVLLAAGLLTYRGWRMRKRTKRANVQRDRLLRCLYIRDGCRPQAVGVLNKITAAEGVNVTYRDRPKVERTLKKYTRKREKGQRQTMASAIVAMFVNEIRALEEEEMPNLEDDALPTMNSDIVRDSFAGAMLLALHLKPVDMMDKLLEVSRTVDANQRERENKELVAKWIREIMGKLKSW